MQPVHGFFELCQRDRVLTARKLARLKPAQAIDHDRKQRFVRHAVDANFLDRTMLELYSRAPPSVVLMPPAEQVLVTSVAVLWVGIAFSLNHNRCVERIDFMVGE